MAKAKMNNPKRPLAPKEKLLLQESIGGAIPTPTEVENIRRPSQVSSKLVMEGVDCPVTMDWYLHEDSMLKKAAVM